jgi:branched-chain amino acid aminotransferase
MVEQITVTRVSESRLTEKLRESSDFGTVFSDHMLVAEYENGAWNEARIVPYSALSLPPSLSALHYAQAVFEGFKAHRTADGGVAIFRPRENAARLNRSATRLAMPPVPKSLFLDGVTELVRLDRDWVPYREGGALYIRPIYFGADEALPVRPAKRYRFAVFTCPVGPYFADRVRLLTEERYARAMPGGTGDVKAAGNYASGLVAARAAQEEGFHAVLWLDALEHRFIEECGVMNIFFVIQGVVVTPPLTGTILAGVTRDSVLALLHEMGAKVKERPIAIDEVVAADKKGTLAEAFGVGTAVTVAPIESIRYRGQDIRPSAEWLGSIAAQVRSRLEAIRTGQAPDKYGWLLHV